MAFRDEKKQTLGDEETRSAFDAPLSEREKRGSVATFPLYGPSALDNPPPFEPALAGHKTAPWHAYGDVAKWEPEFRALASALDRGRALGEWNLAFAHLRAGARRALACCRAEQYAHFAELLEQLAADEPNPSVTLTRAEPHSSDTPGVGGVSSDDTRALRLSTLREKLATSETDHAARILRVTFGRRAVAEKQLRSGLRDRRFSLEASSANANDDELNKDDFSSSLTERHGESDMADPPTLAEMLAATRVLRGIWVHAPASCAAAGAAGAADALTRALEPAGAPPPPPRDSPSDLLQRALEQWRLDQGLEADDEKRSGRGSRPSDDIADTAFVSSSSPPPLKVAFPEGKGEDGSTNASLVSIGWDVEDPEAVFGQPSLDVVRCEILEALLSLMARDEPSQSAFVKRGGVRVVAGYLVPWLAEERDEAPGELVQRCIVFLGVLIRHVLPTTGTDADAESGQGLAARAEATLEATIGAETTAEILEAAAHLHDVGDEGENENENDADASGDDASESASPYGVSPRRPSSREAARFRV
jgi:hypothetical protein